MSEDKEPDWAAELAKGGEALRLQAESIVKAAEQFAAGGLGRHIARAVGADMRELLRAREPVVRHVALYDAGAGVDTLAVAGVATASASAPMPQVRVATQAERGLGQILALVLVAIATWRLLVVPEQDRAAVDHYLTVIGVALTVAVLIWNKQNKPK